MIQPWAWLRKVHYRIHPFDNFSPNNLLGLKRENYFSKIIRNSINGYFHVIHIGHHMDPAVVASEGKNSAEFVPAQANPAESNINRRILEVSLGEKRREIHRNWNSSPAFPISR